VLMYNEHHQLFTDEVVSGMNVHFYKVIKYLVIIPFGVLLGTLFMLKEAKGAQLPE
jgi:hypothetical protein